VPVRLVRGPREPSTRKYELTLRAFGSPLPNFAVKS